jgi:hypothetical protein
MVPSKQDRFAMVLTTAAVAIEAGPGHGGEDQRRCRRSVATQTFRSGDRMGDPLDRLLSAHTTIRIELADTDELCGLTPEHVV